jgi:MarR family transcriptional regulator, temperature-dependent positive regulator of motility
MPSSPDPPDRAAVLPSHRVPAHLARRFHQICLGVIAEILVDEDLTPQQYGVLTAIHEEPGCLQRVLASRAGVDPVSVGHIVDSLEQRGLAERRLDPDDRRARRLYLTRSGTAVRNRLSPALLAAQNNLLAPLTEAERVTFMDMLVHVVEANEVYARPGNGRRKPRQHAYAAKKDGSDR